VNKSAPTVKALFDHANEISSPAERQAYLDQACAGAPEIRQQVEALLRAFAEAPESFLEKPACPLPATGAYQPGDDTPAHPPGDQPETVDHTPRTDPPQHIEGPGTQIGLYRLVDKLGEGGMGTVYLAEQKQPLRRQVALKIIKPGMDSVQIVARFEAERQALALMDHGNIARVYEAGTTAQGRPYFVMELVKGIPLTRFCNDNTLTLRQRLLLFVTVCQAIQHAHQKGVMHRDLKTSNVLVALQDGKPVPKVIDFGLAKATEQPLTDRSLSLATGSIVGTFEYMSPEQADISGKGVDTRTDVYSLGVVLYELLTGTTPIERSRLRGAGLLDVLEWIKEEEAPRPSSRVGSLGQRLAKVAFQRKAEPARLAKLLRGELDWIVLKALEKDRNRRYESASDFAKDVQRYLDDEPVEACPPSLRYRLGKFVRKHRTLLATAAGFVVVLLLGIAGLTAGIIVVNAERQRALIAEKKTRKALGMTWGGIRLQIRKQAKPGDTEKIILRNMLQELRQLLGEPGAGRELRAAAAETEFRVANLSALLGASADAEAGYNRAIALYEQLAKEFPAEVEYRAELARCHFDLGYLWIEQGKRPEAEAAYRRAIDWHEKVAAELPDEPAFRRELADAYTNLGGLLRDGLKIAEADKAFREAITLGEKVAGEAPGVLQYRIDLAAGYHNFGNIVRDQGDARAALAWYGKAIRLLDPLDPRPADATLFLRNAYWDRANALGQLGRHAEASQDWQRAFDLATEADRAHLRLFLAAAQMEEKLQAQSKPAGPLLYEAATVNARATAAAAATEEIGLQNHFGKRALELLEQARTAGWFRDPRQIKHLQEDKDFDSLPRADFKAFLESLEAGKCTKDGSEKK